MEKIFFHVVMKSSITCSNVYTKYETRASNCWLSLAQSLDSTSKFYYLTLLIQLIQKCNREHL